jgi:two-component system sensor histidine kinase KdpD
VTPPGNNEHCLIAVLVGENPDPEHVVRWSRTRAERLQSPWIVIYVETPRPRREAEHSQLTRSLALARELGAEVVTTTGDDVIANLLRIAKQRNVTEIIFGKDRGASWWRRLRSDVDLRRLLRDSGDIVIHAVPVRDEGLSLAVVPRRRVPRARSTLPQYVMAVGAVTAVTLAAFVFAPVVGAHATALVFLLAVVLLAVVVERGPALLAAALSALSWEFFFLPPVFAFRVSHFEDAMLLGMYFVVALVLGQLTARIRAQEEAERRREERATALYLLTRELSQAGNLDQLVQKIVRQMESAFDTQVAILTPDSVDGLKVHPASTLQPTLQDQQALASALAQRQNSRKFSENLRTQDMYVPLGASERPLGIIGLGLRGPLSMHRQNLLEAFSQQVALAFERHHLNEISDRAKLLAESERLGKTLLDSMSHEIRTPIAAIKSATGNLAEFSVNSLQREMIGEIEQATERLNRLVGNVLEVSRLESGNFRPRLNECDVTELIHVAVAETEHELAHHKLSLHVPADLPLVRMDFVLMQQVLTNLLSNAAAHTPPGTAIELSAKVEDKSLVLVVADTGPGIPVESLGRVFNKFYRAPNAPTGGTGLGLSLVKGFVEAHGGRVKAENRQGSGAIFTVYLPLEATKTPA